MESISQMEPDRRGVYGGAIGYASFNNSMDWCIAIRCVSKVLMSGSLPLFSTIVVKDGIAYVQAGAGIVFDSDPLSEYKETMTKMMGALNAIYRAESQGNAKVWFHCTSALFSCKTGRTGRVLCEVTKDRKTHSKR